MPSEERFNSTNWVEWKAMIWAAAKSCGLTGYLSRDIARPSSGPQPAEDSSYWGSPNPTLNQWLQQDAFAQGLVVLNVKNAIGHGVKTEGTATETWLSLTSICDAVSDLSLVQAEKILRSITYVDGTDLDAHFSALRKAWSEANGQGAKILDAGFRMIILVSMPKTWSVVITALRLVTTLSEVILQLTLHGNILMKDDPTTTSTPTHALATNLGRGSRRPRDTTVCTNPVCRRPSHPIEKCFKPGGGMEGQFLPWWNKRGGTDAPVATANAVVTTIVPTLAPGVSSPNQYYAFSIFGGPDSTVGTVTYADSAASDHFFVEQSDFVTYTPNKDHKGSTAAIAGAFPILCSGNICKSTIYKGRRIQLTFENVLHAPSLTHNLVLIGCLDISGKYILFGGGVGTFHNKNGVPFMSGP
jgi:hypothetical protein